MNLTDTHTHLYLPEFDADRESLLKRSVAAGINKYYLPNIDSTSIEMMFALEARFPENCFAMMGLHPCSVNAEVKKELSVVESHLKTRKFIGIGEIGLDLYWDKTYLEEQQEAFRQQVQWALEYKYPVSIHCRDAFDELYAELTKFTRLPRSVFHCFSGTLEQARKILELGDFKLGIGGVVTFRNSGLDKVVENLALENLVLETDAPYLAPVPFRGKRNEPAYLLEIAKKVAQVKNVTIAEVAEVTTRNAEYIFQNS